MGSVIAGTVGVPRCSAFASSEPVRLLNDSKIKLRGDLWQAQNASKPYSLERSDGCFRFEVRPGDRWPNDAPDKARSELCGVRKFKLMAPIHFGLDIMVEPAPVSKHTWLVLFQFHCGDVVPGALLSPDLAVAIRTVNGHEQLVVTGETSPTHEVGRWAYKRVLGSMPFKRGVPYRIRGEFINGQGIDHMPFTVREQEWQGHCGYIGSSFTGRFGRGPGRVLVHVNGQSLVDLDGIATGYATEISGPYAKFGIYASAAHGADETALVVHSCNVDVTQNG